MGAHRGVFLAQAALSMGIFIAHDAIARYQRCRIKCSMWVGEQRLQNFWFRGHRGCPDDVVCGNHRGMFKEAPPIRMLDADRGQSTKLRKGTKIAVMGFVAVPRILAPPVAVTVLAKDDWRVDVFWADLPPRVRRAFPHITTTELHIAVVSGGDHDALASAVLRPIFQEATHASVPRQ